MSDSFGNFEIPKNNKNIEEKSVINMPTMLDAKFPNRTSNKVREENKEIIIFILLLFLFFSLLLLVALR